MIAAAAALQRILSQPGTWRLTAS